MTRPLRVAVDARILDTPGHERVGVGRYAFELTRALAAVRPEWDLRVLSNRPDLFGAAARPTRWPTDRAAGRVLWLHTASWAGRGAARADAWLGTAFTLPAWWRGPSVVTIHDLMFLLARHTYSGSLNARYATVATRAAARRAARILCGSEETRERLAEAWGIDPAKVVVTPYGVSDAFGPEGPDAEGVPDPYLLFVGTFEPRKGLDTLHDAVRRVNRDGRRVSLVLAGRPGWGMQETLDALRRDPAVHVRENPSDGELASLYRGALATVYPSGMEGFGLPVAEAMASGSPVVASSLRCIQEFAGDAPLYAEAGDAPAFADRIGRLLDSPELREARREAGLRAARELRWSAVAETAARSIEFAVAARRGGR
jgi:glycosyltransferase involved in cell wall biosynthesis